MIIDAVTLRSAPVVFGIAVASMAAIPLGATETSPPADTGPFVVLSDGTRIDAARVERSGTMIVVTMANGMIVGYDASEVSAHSSASGAVGGTETSRSKASKAPSSLGGYASSISLAVPEEGGLLRGATTAAASPTQPEGDTAAAQPDQGPTAETPPGMGPLEAAVVELAARWKGFNRSVIEVDQRCRNYSYATTPFGSPFVVHNSNTAHCQDAVRRANVELDELAARHAGIQTMARQAGMPPGEGRALFRKHGVQGFPNQLAAARRRVAVSDVERAREP